MKIEPETALHRALGIVAASVLARGGQQEVFNVLGGMTAWKRAGFPVRAGN